MSRRTNAVCLALVLAGFAGFASAATESVMQFVSDNFDPCCSFPCQHGGICVPLSNHDHECDCTATGYYGKNCDIPEWRTLFFRLLRPGPQKAHNLITGNSWFWAIINQFEWLRRLFMRVVVSIRVGSIDIPSPLVGNRDYATLDGSMNKSMYARILPPVPARCPSPMGTKGPHQLPPAEQVAEKLFRRKTFKPDGLRTSVLFAYFAQHFTHQFFKTDLQKGPEYTWGNHNVDLSHIYGRNEADQQRLRQWTGGRLRSQMIDGEEFPPYLKDVPVTTAFPHYINSTKARDEWFAIGHEAFNMLPGLFLWATIWLREHNRVCRILEQEHPDWDDERLYQTAKLVLLGETLKIVVEEYVQHISNYQFKLLFDCDIMAESSIQYQNHIHYEFNLLYHWHSLMPDSHNVSGQSVAIRQVLFNPKWVVEHGVKSVTESFSRQLAGQVGALNHGEAVYPIAIRQIEQGRQMRLQSFNEYRKRFRLRPYRTFMELVGDESVAEALQQLYKDMDAVELYIGLMIEQRKENGMFGQTLIEMGSPYSLQGLFGNVLCSRRFWRPITFGGESGWRIVHQASMQRLFCDNTAAGQCPFASFRVPEDAAEQEVSHADEL